MIEICQYNQYSSGHFKMCFSRDVLPALPQRSCPTPRCIPRGWLVDHVPMVGYPFLMNRKTKTSIHPEMFINVYQMLDLAWLGEFKYWLIHVNPHFVGHNDDMWKTHPGRVAELRGFSTGRSWGSSAQEGLENASCNGRFRQKIRAGSVSKCIIIGYQKCI